MGEKWDFKDTKKVNAVLDKCVVVVKLLICMHHKLQEPSVKYVKYYMSHVAPLEDYCVFT